MLGTKERAFAPLVAVSLEALVPHNHFSRHLQRTLDLSFVRDLVEATYLPSGRPSIDPEVFFKLHLVMFFEGIRSERLLMRHATDRLSVRWYVGYDLNEPLPDHSSLTRIRTRYGLDVFRRFFEVIVEQCVQAKVVWGRELSIEATKVNANANLDSLVPRFAVEAREAHLAALFAQQQEEAREPPTPTQESAATSLVTDTAGGALPVAPTLLPVSLPVALREELAEENAARHEWIAEEGRPHRELDGVSPRVADVRISTTDPDATAMHLKGGGTHLGYQVHYLIDGGKHRIILGALVTPGEVRQSQPMLDLLWRVRFRWKLHPGLVCGDTKYGTYENIAAIERAGIHAYVALPNWENKSEVWSTLHFRVCCGGGSVSLSSRDHPETLERASHRRRTPDLSRACVGVQSLSREPPTARRAARGAKSPGMWRKATWNGSAAIKRPAPTRKRSASDRCGSNPCLGKPKTGMGCGGSGCGGCGE